MENNENLLKSIFNNVNLTLIYPLIIAISYAVYYNKEKEMLSSFGISENFIQFDIINYTSILSSFVLFSFFSLLWLYNLSSVIYIKSFYRKITFRWSILFTIYVIVFQFFLITVDYYNLETPFIDINNILESNLTILPIVNSISFTLFLIFFLKFQDMLTERYSIETISKVYKNQKFKDRSLFLSLYIGSIILIFSLNGELFLNDKNISNNILISDGAKCELIRKYNTKYLCKTMQNVKETKEILLIDEKRVKSIEVY